MHSNVDICCNTVDWSSCENRLKLSSNSTDNESKIIDREVHNVLLVASLFDCFVGFFLFNKHLPEIAKLFLHCCLHISWHVFGILELVWSICCLGDGIPLLFQRHFACCYVNVQWCSGVQQSRVITDRAPSLPVTYMNTKSSGLSSFSGVPAKSSSMLWCSPNQFLP